MARLISAALLLVVVLSTVLACPAPTCPGNYVPIVDQSTVCGYVCQTPAKLNCPASIGGPRLCGGTSGVPCPSIACAQATSYAVSGPNGERVVLPAVESVPVYHELTGRRWLIQVALPHKPPSTPLPSQTLHTTLHLCILHSSRTIAPTPPQPSLRHMLQLLLTRTQVPSRRPWPTTIFTSAAAALETPRLMASFPRIFRQPLWLRPPPYSLL